MPDVEFERLKGQDQEGRSEELRRALSLPPIEGAEHASEFARRFLALALEAYRRDRITKSKLQHLAGRIGLLPETVQMLIESAGLADSAAESALLPG